MKLEYLIRVVTDCQGTCTIENLKPMHLCYAKNQKYFNRLMTANVKVRSLVDGSVSIPKSRDIIERINPIVVSNPEKLFVQFHNHINSFKRPPTIVWGQGGGDKDGTVIVADHGMRYIRDGQQFILMKHMGTVVFGDRVDVGAHTVIHRGTIDDTIIGNDTKIGSNVSIGHNCLIGARVMITSGVIIAGSVSTGDDCWFGVGTVVRDHLKICGGVKTGAGSVVVKDITEPGLYFGNPATKRGEWDGSL